jgi:hypothetical protein
MYALPTTTKETMTMKAGFLIFTSLFLAVVCLAAPAMAQSVTGGGAIVLSPGDSTSINVSARSGPAGIIHYSTKTLAITAEVVEFNSGCVVGNEAIVVGEITHSTNPDYLGAFFFLFVQDNGNRGDVVQFVPQEDFISCEDLFPNFPFIITNGFTLTGGNITVSP